MQKTFGADPSCKHRPNKYYYGRTVYVALSINTNIIASLTQISNFSVF